ncbi:Sodium/hydrogen exchanger 2 [Halotydeus destructor]|nr:Sodium/hydrogen exchanger 2 [Halotydeus destructor]
MVRLILLIVTIYLIKLTRSQNIKHEINSSLVSETNKIVNDQFLRRTDLSAEVNRLYHRLTDSNETKSLEHGSQLHFFDYERVRPYMFVTSLLLTASLIKITFSYSPLHHQAPESCVLIILGVFFGLMGSYLSNQFQMTIINGNGFFFLLLPPIILESAYDLNDKQFYRNMSAVMLFAVIGTGINIVGIAFSLMGINDLLGMSLELPLVEIFLFSTIVSAVDPVTVLAIFDELGVNKTLHYIVFGESLFNDAVVITVFGVVQGIATNPIDEPGKTLALSAFRFAYVIIVAIFVGILVGVITCLLTKITKYSKVTEPLVVFCLAYGSYVFAEMFHASGIISLTVCGLIQTGYARYNISHKSQSTLKQFVRTSSKISETIIFFFLGRVVVADEHVWNSSFIIATTILITVWRLISVYVCSQVANKWLIRSRPINRAEGAVMAFGGLRGAIAFSLANILREGNRINNAKLFMTASLFTIFFTVFVFGATTKPLVQMLRVERRSKRSSLVCEKMNSFLIERYVMTLIEELSGQRQVNYWMTHLEGFNNQYIRKYLIVGGSETVERMDISTNLQTVDSRDTQQKFMTLQH